MSKTMIFINLVLFLMLANGFRKESGYGSGAGNMGAFVMCIVLLLNVMVLMN